MEYIELATNEFNVTLPDSYPAGGKICDINDTSNNPNGYITNPDSKGNNKQFLSLGVLILMEELLVNFTKEKSLQRACVNTIKSFERASSNE